MVASGSDPEGRRFDSCPPSQHTWKETGRRDVHARIGHQVTVTYLRCTKCRQNGFRRPPRDVLASLLGRQGPVYTWDPREEHWEQ